MMTGRVTKGEGWMKYHLHIDGEKCPRRIYHRNHNCSYIKRDGAWVRVYVNEYILDSGSFDEIPMVLTADGEWDMVHEYEQLPGGASAPYGIVK